MSEFRQMRLPEDLCAAVEAKFQHKFANLEELLTFVMNDLLAEDACKADEAEQRLVEERLRELGYL